MRFLRDLGLTSKELIKVSDVSVRPAEVLARLLEMHLSKKVDDIAIIYVRARSTDKEYSELAVLRGPRKTDNTDIYSINTRLHS